MTNSNINIVLTDPTLFGNDAAEDEREEIFHSYALKRPELKEFANIGRRLGVARAYKGEGKSALLRLTVGEVARMERPPVVVSKTADELAPEVVGEYASWVRAWKASIVNVLAVEVGARIGVAWSDDAMALVEESEKAGFRGRSVLSSILDRLDLPEISIGPAKIKALQRRVLGTTNPGEAVKRWAKQRHVLWLFVDDVDKNFTNTPTSNRTAVRPNIWTVLKREYESLSHVEQYLVNLTWTEADSRRLLARRIEAYLRRTSQSAAAARPEDDLIALAFQSPMAWGRQERSAHVVLHTLSVHRLDG